MELLTLVRHGRALRLKAPEGTYSYYHPQHVFTGLGWDAQTGSLLLAKKMNSILMLGLGGGTVARQCRALFPNAVIVGVELERRVINLAYRQFALGAAGVKVVAMEGETYLRRTDRRFDGIIDDMWLPLSADQKPVLADPAWSRLVRSRLTACGIYAVNLYSRNESPYHVKTAVSRLARIFPALREVRPASGQTTVIAGGVDLCTSREARANLRRLPGTFAHDLSHLRFRTL
ncbi:MAG: spermidine synthase [Pyrinomonadaceae bacterium]